MTLSTRRRVGAGLATALAAGALATTALVTPAAGAATGAAAPNCAAVAAEPFHASLATLHACGYRTAPLLHRTRAAGGVTEYVYRVHGMTVTMPVPPAGFSLARATAAQLAALQITRPAAGAAARTAWLSQYAGLAPYTPPAYLIEAPFQATPLRSGNWSGITTGAASTNKFTKVSSTWTEPSLHSSQCANNYEVTWVGLGGQKSSNLAQNGTFWSSQNGHKHQAWWEILPASVTFIDYTATPGQAFKAVTQKVSGGFHFTWTAAGHTTRILNVQSTRFDGRTAEAIIERPTVGGSLSNLSNFETMHFRSVAVNGTSLHSRSYQRIAMYDSQGRLMASPGTVNSSGGLPVTQKRCN